MDKCFSQMPYTAFKVTGNQHLSNGYFYLINILATTLKSKHFIKYQNVPSAIRTVPVNDCLNYKLS